MRGVEAAGHASLESFGHLAKRSGFSVAECALAARTGRLADVVRVAQRRDVGRRRALAAFPPDPALTLQQVRVRMRMLQLRGS